MVSGAFLFLPRGGSGQALLYIGVGLAELVAVVVGIRRARPTQPRSWQVLGAGVALYGLGNTIWFGYPVIIGGSLPFPSVADALIIGAYVCLIAGLGMLVRARTVRDEGAGALLDAAIITVGAAAIAWEYVLGPTAAQSGTPLLARLVALAHPLLDLALVALMARILCTRGSRSGAFWLLTAFITAQLAADGNYAVALLRGTFSYGHPLTVGWMISFGCLGAAALHPGMRSLTEVLPEPRRHSPSWFRLAFVAVAALLVPGIYLIRQQGSTTELVGWVTLLFLLAIARMGVMLRELSRQATTLERSEAELHQTVERLHRVGELQARMAAIVESTDEAIVGLTTSLAVTSWNGGAERLYGYSSEEALGRRMDSLVRPSNGTRSSILVHVARGQRLAGHDTDVHTKDGRTVAVSLTASPILGADGAVIGIASFAHDITERRRFEETLRMSEQRFRSLVQRSSDLTLLCDAEGELAYVSPASHGILGLDDAWLTGRGLEELFHPADLDEIRRRLAGSGDEAQIAECRVRHADGLFRRVEVTFTDLMEDPGVAGIVLNLRDVSDRHRLESELRHAQKLESVGQLASGIAHEINTPIQFVGDNVRFLQDAFGTMSGVLDAYRQAGGSPEQAAALEHARNLETEADTAFLIEEIPLALDQTLDGVNRVANIVRAMKAFGHPSNDEKAPTDLNEAVRNTLVVANNQVKYVADAVTELGDLPQVWCHLGDINQVLLNLVVNAAQAVAEASRDTNQRGTITVRSFLDADHAVIEVADTGVGIPPEIADRVFEPFFTTKEVGVGTGQGLALAHSLIHDRHGGSIEFTSQPGAGTTFTVRLPVESSRQSTSLKELVP